MGPHVADSTSTNPSPPPPPLRSTCAHAHVRTPEPLPTVPPCQDWEYNLLPSGHRPGMGDPLPNSSARDALTRCALWAGRRVKQVMAAHGFDQVYIATDLRAQASGSYAGARSVLLRMVDGVVDGVASWRRLVLCTSWFGGRRGGVLRLVLGLASPAALTEQPGHSNVAALPAREQAARGSSGPCSAREDRTQPPIYASASAGGGAGRCWCARGG